MAHQLSIIPTTVTPREDELLSSWLYRLSQVNYTKAHTFTKFHFPKFQVWNRDIDKLANTAFFQIASQLTTIPVKEIEALSLRDYEGSLYEYCNANGNQKWVLPVKIFHRTRLRNGLQFCPSCLIKDGKNPYFRRSWRLSLSICCPDCQILLHDQCPFCEKPVTFFRNELGFKLSTTSLPIYLCCYCKNDLRKSPRYPAKIGVVSAQIRLKKYLTQGFVRDLPYALQYFEVLYQVIKLLISRSKKLSRLQSMILGYYPSEMILAQKSVSRIEFDRMSTLQRENILPTAVWLLDHWPKRFISACQESGVSSAYINKDFKYVPFWFRKEIIEKLFFPNPVSSGINVKRSDKKK